MIETAIITFSLVLVRTATLIAVFPLFSGRNLSHLVKVGLAVSLAVLWSSVLLSRPGAVSIEPRLAESVVAWGLAVGREALTGGVLGVALGLFLLPAQIAGAYIAQEMGLTLATLTDPANGASVSVWSQIMSSLAALLFFALDLHHAVFRALFATFWVRPVGSRFALPDPEWVLAGMADAQEAGLLIAAPLGAVLFITLVTMLVVMRAAPQFNLFSFGLSFRLALGMGAALIFLPEMCLLMQRMFAQLSHMTVVR